MSNLAKLLPSFTKCLMAFIGFLLIGAVIFTLYAAKASAIGLPVPPATWVSLAAGGILLFTSILNDTPAIEKVAADIKGIADRTTATAQLLADTNTMLGGLPLALVNAVNAVLPAHSAAAAAAAATAVSDAVAASGILNAPLTVTTAVDAATKVAESLDPTLAPTLDLAQKAIEGQGS